MSEIVTRDAVQSESRTSTRSGRSLVRTAPRPNDRPDLVMRLIEHDPAAVLVAVHEGRIVGTSVSGWDGWRAKLYRLAVVQAGAVGALAADGDLA
ncbi:hypothetical protein [Nocardioides sp.]|uniref:hypothetical protein n=1 Tax=Nocardioides sp. TaxID=35761 RepID=UPI002BF03C4E|nr:hypothetical protein [Nocardioides sp.]HSX67116.1 hypothetical protein [Nocardioides sp.]